MTACTAADSARVQALDHLQLSSRIAEKSSGLLCDIVLIGSLRRISLYRANHDVTCELMFILPIDS